MQLKTDGLVIKVNDTGENDRVITVLTRDYGTVRAFANGAKKMKSRFQSATQLLNYSAFTFYAARDSYIIDDAVSKEVFFKLREDIEKIALAQYFCELAAELAPEMDEAEEYLRLILNALDFLTKDKRPALLLKAVTEMRLLCLSGYMPAVDGCAVCGKQEDALMVFDVGEGQLLCSEERKPGLPLDTGALTALRHICGSPLVKLFSFTLSDASLKLLADAVEHYLLATTQRKFKTLDFYKILALHNGV